MLKKIISATLSLTMLISATAADGFNSLIADNSSNNGHNASDSRETQLKGQNSFGKYIEKTASKEKEEGIKPLSLKADTDGFKVARLDFDLESGKLTAITTQSSACTLKVEFINDDDPQNVYEVKTPVKVGERVETILSVDKGQLPEFFKVRAVLVDANGHELGDPYVLSDYMRFMQELAKATVEDYNEDYVVNLDADETTNFLVLNEDTVMAESSEEENTLVSADYDNDVYVFENINDSIRYLSAGDYFYAQPNEKDMVAVNVESIDIDGDTATIKGGGDVDDMFDVIKIDVGSNEIDTSALENDNVLEDININGVPEEENEDYSVTYNGVVQDESGEYALEYNVLNYSDTNTPKSNFKLFDSAVKKVIGDGRKITIPLEWKIAPFEKNAIGLTDRDEYGQAKRKKYNIERDKGYDENGKKKEHDFDNGTETFDFNAEVDIAASLKFTIEFNITYYKQKKNYKFGWDGYADVKLEAEGSAKVEIAFGLFKVPIVIPAIPGLVAEIGGEFKIGVEASVSISTGLKFHFAHRQGSDGGGGDTDYDNDSPIKQQNKFEIEGKFYVEFTLSVSLKLLCDIFVAKVELPIKFELKATPFSVQNSWADLYDADIDAGNAFPDTGNLSKYAPQHICKHCYEIEPSISFKVKISVKIPILKKLTIELGPEPFKFGPFHLSLTFKEFGYGKCDHNVYATDLHIIGNDETKAEGLVVKINGRQKLTSSGDTVCVYLEPYKWYTYEIYSNGELIKTDSIYNSEEYTRYDIDLDSGMSQSDSIPLTTTTSFIEPPETHTVTSAIEAIIDNNPNHLMLEYGKLGDNITYSLYPDGFLYIFGYGPMNYDKDPIQNKELVKNVLMEDYATYMRKQLKSEAAEETLIDGYTEKYQEELCGKYLEEHRDRIVNALNENYNVDRDDPDLDEMVDDYLYANAEDLAHEYYNEHSDEYTDALEVFKEELIAESEKRVITSIGNSVFEGCENLESITYEESPNEGKKAFDLPHTITSIGAYAFENCKKLDFGNLVFDNKIEYIGYAAFEDCNGITSVTVPENVKVLGGLAFRDCENLETAVIAADTQELGLGTFYGCNKLRELALPESVKITGDAIGESYELNNLFHNNFGNAFRDVKVPDTLKKVSLLRGDTINYKAFDCLGDLEIIALPEGIKTIKEDAFLFNRTMNIICSDETKELTFSELFRDLESIGDRAFLCCNSLQTGDLVFGDKLTSIGMQAFQENNYMTSLYIPESVTWIGSCAFEDCTALRKAVIKANAEDYRGIFNGSNAMEELVLPSFITIRGDHSLAELFNDNEYGAFNSTDVPESLKTVAVLSGSEIPANAFSGFGGVETIGLPTGIKTIGKRAFPSYSTSLKSIICSDETQDLSFSDLMKYVETIDEEAFLGCKNLQIGELSFGNKLKSVGQAAFSGCSGIIELYIPESAEGFGYKAFSECDSLEKIVIASKKAVLGPGMFYGCIALKEMTLSCFNKIASDQGSYLRNVFHDHNYRWPLETTDKLQKLIIVSGDTMPENYLDGFYGLTVLELPEEISLVEKHATQDLYALEEVIYAGTDEDWEKIDIREENDPLLRAKRTKPAEKTDDHVYGDANGDGIVDMSDAVMIMQVLCNPNRFGINGTDPAHITAEGWKYADADGNGLTVGDALRIQEFLLGIIPSLK